MKVDAIIVGAGVVGLAVAAVLAAGGHEVVALEREPAWGQGASSRNSEVVRAGIHYELGGPKAQLCVRGRDLLYERCRERGIPHSCCGKLVVANEPGEVGALHELMGRGLANGVSDLRILGRDEASDLEPALRCEAALLSPSTGIVHSHALMLERLAELEQHAARSRPAHPSSASPDTAASCR